jgi:hypothetical protein
MHLLFVLFVGMIRTHLEISTPAYPVSCHLGNHIAFLVCQISRHTNVRLLRYSMLRLGFLLSSLLWFVQFFLPQYLALDDWSGRRHGPIISFIRARVAAAAISNLDSTFS